VQAVVQERSLVRAIYPLLRVNPLLSLFSEQEVTHNSVRTSALHMAEMGQLEDKQRVVLAT
jgi:hypothetical protein